MNTDPSPAPSEDSAGATDLRSLQGRALHRIQYNVHPSEKRLTLWRDMTKLRRAGYRLRFRYVKLVVILVGT
jgi:hypothetical protein